MASLGSRWWRKRKPRVLSTSLWKTSRRHPCSCRVRCGLYSALDHLTQPSLAENDSSNFETGEFDDPNLERSGSQINFGSCYAVDTLERALTIRLSQRMIRLIPRCGLRYPTSTTWTCHATHYVFGSLACSLPSLSQVSTSSFTFDIRRSPLAGCVHMRLAFWSHELISM